MKKEKIIVCTTKHWNIENFYKLEKKILNQYEAYLITQSEELSFDKIKNINPKFIFFPHWSWIIPEKIYSTYKCIVFHMTDLPFGRGGSPLQNLIINEIYHTKISALKVEKKLDAGDIYLKVDLDISNGSAEKIFKQASDIIFNKMIPQILKSDITPIKQTGEIITFKRRIPEQSNLDMLENKSLKKIYDFIRMLDAEGYPRAFIKIGNLKIEYTNIQQGENILSGTFTITEDNMETLK